MAPGATGGRVLVIGYGNTLRRDDGVGPRAAELLARDPRCEGAVVMARHQLTPELAADFAEAALVVLVDAGVGLQPGEVAVRQLAGVAGGVAGAASGPTGAASGPGVDPDPAGFDRAGPAARPVPSSAWTHHVDAESLLALARELWGTAPRAFVVAVGPATMDLGEELSPPVERALPAVVDAVARIVAENRPG